MAMTPLPQAAGWMGDPARGAQLGRPNAGPGSDDPKGTAYPYRFALRRVRLNAVGYDSGGAYWGHGAPLYRYEADEGPEDAAALPAGFLRARGRDAAKAALRADYPNARFFR